MLHDYLVLGFVFGQAHRGLTDGFLLLRYSRFCTVESFVLSPFNILICLYLEIIHR